MLASKTIRSLIPLAVMLFLIKFRRTVIGPLWLLVAPALFIVVVGLLYSEIGLREPIVFIPHLAIGLIIWGMTGGFLAQAPNVFMRNRANIKQAGLAQSEICMVEVATQFLVLFNQCLLILAIFLWFGLQPGWNALLALLALPIYALNAYWCLRVFGILGARYQDVTEAIQAVMRVGFLATPIIWMPAAESGRGAVMSRFLDFNPFYHFIEIFRAPLLGNAVAPLTWYVVIGVTIIGLALMFLVTRPFERHVALWV